MALNGETLKLIFKTKTFKWNSGTISVMGIKPYSQDFAKLKWTKAMKNLFRRSTMSLKSKRNKLISKEPLVLRLIKLFNRCSKVIIHNKLTIS